MASADGGKALVRAWIDLINTKATGDVGKLFTDDGVVIYGAYGIPNGEGPKAIGGLLDSFFMGFPDLHTNIEELFDGEDGRVVGRFRVTATHTGDGFMGMKATGKKIDVAGIAIFKFRDGKIAHEWNMDDIFGMLLQIGAIPNPAAK